MQLPSTIDPPSSADRSRRPAPPRRRLRRVDPATVAWPIGLVLLLVALGAWRAGSEHDGNDATAAPTDVATRAFDQLRLGVPRGWKTLDRTDGRITWGAADRVHTVTLASTEASSMPLVAIVREVARQSTESVPGSRVMSGPTLVDTGSDLPRGDSLVEVRLAVIDQGRELQVVQAWRRDARAGHDIVATWTSGDGAWPVVPRTSIPAWSS
jgi:hypothetical protein